MSASDRIRLRWLTEGWTAAAGGGGSSSHGGTAVGERVGRLASRAASLCLRAAPPGLAASLRRRLAQASESQRGEALPRPGRPAASRTDGGAAADLSESGQGRCRGAGIWAGLGWSGAAKAGPGSDLLAVLGRGAAAAGRASRGPRSADPACGNNDPGPWRLLGIITDSDCSHSRPAPRGTTRQRCSAAGRVGPRPAPIESPAAFDTLHAANYSVDFEKPKESRSGFKVQD